MADAPPTPARAPNLVDRFVRWAVGAAVFGALLYLGGSVWAGFDDMRAAFVAFDWRLIPLLVVLTLTNYGLRFLKWHYFLGRLKVPMPFIEDLWNFLAGLAMVISPGKAGELLKPYVVRARTGTPMATTIPALVSERLTDAIAMLALAGISVTTYAADKVVYVVAPLVLVAVGLAVLAHEGLTLAALRLTGRLPMIGRVVPKLEEMVRATRICLAPVPFAVSIALSFGAWFAECVAYWLVLRGLDLAASLDVSVFIYAAATVIGAPAPGGLGVSDGALAVFASTLVGAPQGLAVASALIARVVTLWLGVGVGAVALVRVSRMLGGAIDLDDRADDVPPAG
jgi:uncharacterized protein (TIRG00374 family)